ncbi:MAG: HypC/HybG/HupF family hydrogenase formation chaperone [Candidatus Omnitrophica bacterium]|nr:HypC/HybG/HupF family hydrogenase formation chaperone [Candidatus Omnitrophota bacterium]
MCLAYPMKIVEINGKHALVEAEGIKREVNIEFLKKPQVGDFVMVHAGFAIEKFNPDKVKDILEGFKEYKSAYRKSSNPENAL